MKAKLMRKIKKKKSIRHRKQFNFIYNNLSEIKF